MRRQFLFTSESVSEGHPDKVADQISDAVVDYFLARDPEARVACETMVTTQRIVLAGEIRCAPVYNPTQWPETQGWAPGAREEIEAVVRATVRRIGYEQDGFHWETADYANLIHGQSAHIARGVDASGNKDEGAGDQGIMFGFATDETPVFMPAPLYYSHNILKRLAALRHSGEAPFLEPDAKSQVTLAYEDGRPARAVKVVVSTQHARGYDQARLRAFVTGVIAEVLPPGWMPKDRESIFINPTGLFEIGGPDGDAGLTGRKIIVDTYGGSAPHGGGAFSGKDPSKVDRSAAYAARYVAKNVVAAGLATKCLVQVSYAIGVARPTSVMVTTSGTGKVSDEKIGELVQKHFDLRPKGIIQMLDLLRPIYEKTAAYGHFGRDEPEFTWERTDRAKALAADAGIKLPALA
jgi:methionine adenosyltransferase (EC 2.5.1.6)